MTIDGQQTDHIANGSTIAMELNADGTTSGEIHFKASGDQPALDEDLTGTWTASGDTIRLDQRADTFLRDTPLAVRAGALWGDKTFSGARIQLTLSRNDQDV